MTVMEKIFDAGKEASTKCKEVCDDICVKNDFFGLTSFLKGNRVKRDTPRVKKRQYDGGEYYDDGGYGGYNDDYIIPAVIIATIVGASLLFGPFLLENSFKQDLIDRKCDRFSSDSCIATATCTTGEKCNNDGNCAGNLVCTNSVCTDCRANDSCQEGQSCGNDRDCSDDNNICVSNRCIDCASENICRLGDDCDNDADCGKILLDVCYMGTCRRCSDVDRCTDGQVCEEADDCIENGQTCTLVDAAGLGFCVDT